MATISALRRTAFLTAIFLVASVPCAADSTFLYMAQAGYQPPDILERTAEFTQATGKNVRVVFSEYEDIYDRIVESSKKPAADYDVILVDLIWTADFVNRGIIDRVPSSLESLVRGGCAPEIYGAFEYEDRLWAYPFLANIQLLYYNADLLKAAGYSRPPRTLEELAAYSEAIKKKNLVKYPVFESWRKQEALVCEFTWLVGAYGGNLTLKDGSIGLNSVPCVRALAFMKSLLDRGLVNPYSLQCDELTAAEVFLNGDAVFSTNWTFVTGQMRMIPYSENKGLKAALIPVSRDLLASGKARTSTVSGFQGLAVASNASSKSEAWEFIKFLSSPDFQRRHLNEMSVWQKVWDDPSTRQLDPDIDLKKAQIAGTHNRPQHPKYRAISGIIQDAIFEVLTEGRDPKAALEAAQARIEGL